MTFYMDVNASGSGCDIPATENMLYLFLSLLQYCYGLSSNFFLSYASEVFSITIF
uniref:Uncharacterized protein n=1 Tax=Nelumbo nucifera TaxID=4432 RepID=A0A822YE23_NELNU|nr:TPA_asm: hypothetical protein HUJ06_009588 [Nelumbo nucifera]